MCGAGPVLHESGEPDEGVAEQAGGEGPLRHEGEERALVRRRRDLRAQRLADVRLLLAQDGERGDEPTARCGESAD